MAEQVTPDMANKKEYQKSMERIKYHKCHTDCRNEVCFLHMIAIMSTRPSSPWEFRLFIGLRRLSQDLV